MVRVTLPPAGTVIGVAVGVDQVYSMPVWAHRSIEVTVRSAVPVLAIWAVLVAAVSAVIVPKSRAAGARVIFGCATGGGGTGKGARRRISCPRFGLTGGGGPRSPEAARPG